MEKNILEGVKLEFKDLSEETQKRLYLENKEKFKKEAAKSQYNYVREFLIRDEGTDSETLDELFKVETNTQNILKLLKHPNFQMNDETKKKLSKSDNWKLRELAAKDETNTSEFLNQMLRNEIEGVQDEDVINAILNNLNFKMEEETRKKLSESINAVFRKIIAEDEETSAQLLESMYWKEQEPNILEILEKRLGEKMKSNTLNIVQRKKIFKVLKKVQSSNKKEPLAKYLEQILEIIG